MKETLSGVKYLTLQVAGGEVKTVSVDMGQAKAEKPINCVCGYGNAAAVLIKQLLHT